MKIKQLSLIVLLMLAFIVAGCSGNTVPADQGENPIDKDWETVLADAKGTTVNIYMWGGDELTNSWMDGFVADNLLEQYDITLNRVPMGPDEYLNKLLGEKQAGKQTGTIDMLWINGENFRTARQADLLWGPFAEKIPNFLQYVDKDAPDIAYDFGYPVEGYEVPWGKAQFVFGYDTARTAEPPKSAEALLAWVKDHPGRFTYPELPDFTGSVFVRQLMYELCGGYEAFPYTDEVDKKALDEQLQPLWDYLNEMKPHLWREGTTYPSGVAILHQLFADGEIDLTMTYSPALMSGWIDQGLLPDSVRTYVWDKGTIGNTHFLAIPFNAPNKEGAMVLANFLLSPEAQLSKYVPKNWGDLIALDTNKLPDDVLAEMEAIDTGIATLSPEVLQSHRVPEISAAYIPVIEELWTERVIQNAE
jgi:putative spermidine/putrescine transport system substrate-binding protein